MKTPIVHFEIPADDVSRAKQFYENVFDWKIEKFPMPEGMEDYWSVITTAIGKDKMPTKPGAINGGLMKRKETGQPFMNYIAVESIDKMVKSVEAHGGTICMEKREIAPNMGWIAAFKDTEGNILGLHQMPAKKK